MPGYSARVLRRRKKLRILGLTAFRNEARFLPGFLANVLPQVDGLIALDDQSTDGSGDYLRGQRGVLEAITVPPGAHGDNEDGILRKALIQAAWKYDADWLLGIDADERLERDFRPRAEAEIARVEAEGHAAMWIPFLELWDDASQYRVDGIWGGKRKVCLFKSSLSHVFDERRMHTLWASLPEPAGSWPVADLRLYHLRMIEPEDRRRRYETYRRLDPNNELQAIGYEYMLDERDLELRQVEPGREFIEGRPQGRRFRNGGRAAHAASSRTQGRSPS